MRIYLENAFSLETRNSRIRQLLDNEMLFDVLCMQLTVIFHFCINGKNTMTDCKEMVERLCLLLSKIIIDEPSCIKLFDMNISPILTGCLSSYAEDYDILYDCLIKTN